MANFIYDEGAVAMLSANLDWTDAGVNIFAGLYDNTYVPAIGDVFTDIPAGALIDSQPLLGRTALANGRASADGVTYLDVSPSQNNGRLTGIVIYRGSDNLMIYNMDTGFDGLAGVGSAGVDTGPVFNVQMLSTDVAVSFDLVPGLSTGQAWFRP